MSEQPYEDSAWESDWTTRWQDVKRPDYAGPPGRAARPGDMIGTSRKMLPTPVERRFMAPGSEFSWAMSRTPDQRMVLQQRMERLGLYDEGAQIIPSLWSPTDAKAIRQVMDVADANGLSIPEALTQMENNSVALGGASGSSGGGGGGGGGGPYVSTSSSTSRSSSSSVSYNISGKDTARELLRSALTDRLGRAPSKGETRAFLRRLNRAERADPSTSRSSSVSRSTSRSVSGPGGSNSVSSDTSSSKSVSHTSKVNPSAMAERVARGDQFADERNAYQRLLYFDVLASMIGE